MFRRKVATVLFLTCLVTVAQAQKKRVAVMNFDYATVQTSVSAIFGTNQDIGKGIADMLVDKLVGDGVFSVIERKALDKIIAEQNFSNSDRADPSSAAKLARILGVDAIVIGSITQFGRDDKNTSIGGGAIGGITGRFGIGGVKKSNANAVVQITARIVNTTTAEIMASVTAKGESSRSGTGLLGAGGGGGSAAGAGMDMSSSNFANTIIGEATTKAVTELGRQLDEKGSALPSVAIHVSGLVADASPDGTMILNIGSKAGLKVGDRLEVKRKVREVRDPESGKVIRSIEDPVGTCVITEVDESSSVGKFSGTGPAKVGDTVSSSK